MVAQVNRSYLKAGMGRTLVRFASYGLFEGRPLTTRGRWFNPVVFGLSSWLSRRGPRGEVRQPVFIVGTGRSGTTLLGTILSLHKDVGYLNEPKAMWNRVLPDEDVIGSYSEDAGRYWLSENDATPDVAERFDRLYGGYLRFVRRSRIVDKYPEAVFRIGFVRKIFPDARFIWLLRNGTDTIASIERWSGQHGQGGDTWWGRNDRKWTALVEQVCRHHELLRDHEDELLALSSDVDRAAVEWSVSFLQGRAVQKTMTDDIMQLRYEDLLSDPANRIRDVLSFCNLDDDPAVLEYVLEQVKGGRRNERITLSPLVREHFEGAMREAGYG